MQQPETAVARALADAVRVAGSDVASSPPRVRGMVSDVLGDDARTRRAEIDAVVIAVEEGVPERLRPRGDAGAHEAAEQAVGMLRARGLDVDVARFAVSVWQYALGLLEEDTPPPTLTVSLEAPPAADALAGGRTGTAADLAVGRTVLPSDDGAPQRDGSVTPNDTAGHDEGDKGGTARKVVLALSGALSALLVVALVAMVALRDSSDQDLTAKVTDASDQDGGSSADGERDVGGDGERGVGGDGEREPAERPARDNVGDGIRLGMLMPLTGTSADMYEGYARPIQFAIDEINEAGGVLGQPVEMYERDDGSGTETALAALDQLFEDDLVDAVAGLPLHVMSAELLTAHDEAGVPACTGFADTTIFYEVGGYFFQTQPAYATHGTALAEAVVNHGASSVAVLASDDNWGESIHDPLIEALEAAGVEIAAVEQFNPDSADRYLDEVDLLTSSGADAIVIIGFGGGWPVVDHMVREGLDVAGQDPIVLGNAAAFIDLDFEDSDDIPERTLTGVVSVSMSTHPAGSTHPLLRRLQEATTTNYVYAPHVYDCVMLTALAIEAAGSENGRDIARALPEVVRGKEDCTSFTACVELLRSGATIHYRGASSGFDSWWGPAPSSGLFDRWIYREDGSPYLVKGSQFEVRWR